MFLDPLRGQWDSKGDHGVLYHFTCSDGGDGESAEDWSGVVTIGAAFRSHLPKLFQKDTTKHSASFPLRLHTWLAGRTSTTNEDSSFSSFSSSVDSSSGGKSDTD